MSYLPVPLALLGVLLVRPDLLTGAVVSWRAWVVSAVVVALSFAVRRLVARRSPAVAPWAGTAVTLGLLAALVVPSLGGGRTVVEEFPPVVEAAEGLPVQEPVPVPTASTAVAATQPPVVAPPVAPAAPPAARRSAPVPTAAPTTTAPRPAPTAAAPAPRAPRPTSAPSPSPAARASTAAPASAVRLSSGRLSGINHRAEGGVAIYRLSGGNALRFEDVSFDRQPGPSVWLVPPGSRSTSGGVRLGKLKAEHGSFSYTLPGSVNADASWSVLIWCDPYETPIGAADLS